MKIMTTPREWNEGLIDNPNLPEGFEVTEEMLQDPTINFFLNNYTWPIKVDVIKNWQDKWMSFANKDGTISNALSHIRGEFIDGDLDVDFERFDLYWDGFIFNTHRWSANTMYEDRMGILEQFLPKEKREEFRRLNSQTEWFNYYLSSTLEEVEALIWLVQKEGYDEDVKKLMQAELAKVIELLQKK